MAQDVIKYSKRLKKGGTKPKTVPSTGNTELLINDILFFEPITDTTRLKEELIKN
jgi:hypothetical protein